MTYRPLGGLVISCNLQQKFLSNLQDSSTLFDICLSAYLLYIGFERGETITVL